MTNQEVIREAYKQHKERIIRLRGDIKIEQAYIYTLQALCSHPDKYQYSAMGELGWKCDDCGYQT